METVGRRNRGWDQAGNQRQQPALLGGCGRVASTSEAFRRSSCILSDLCDNVPELFLPLQHGGLEVGVGGWEALSHPSNLMAMGKKMGLGYCVLLFLLLGPWVPSNMCTHVGMRTRMRVIERMHTKSHSRA